jgi:putative ABC transport system permease protein
MKSIALAWHYLWARPLASGLNLLLLALGLTSIAFVLLAHARIERAFERDLAGIDVVVGAKGSPMQLILSGVFHLDAPTGNVPLAEIEALKSNPLLAEVIPLSLGDSFRGFRIVGTTPAYLRHYQATFAQGRIWEAPLQAVLGAEVARQSGLQVGGQFAGSHGLGGGGDVHGQMPYTVTGVLAPTGGVLDRLMLTSLDSVWKVHETDTALDEEDLKVMQAEREVTLALITYRSPLAAVTFPRFVNAETGLQAAAPAVEITRLLGMVGVGVDVLRALAAVLLLTAGLSVFIALWGAVRERRADLALLRMLGAPARKVAGLLLLESLWLALLAAVIGVVTAQALMALAAWALKVDGSLSVGAIAWPVELAIVPVLALSVALLAAWLPARAAYRVSVFALLQGR